MAFPTSCRPAAQREFLRGLALQHSFWYEESAKAFGAAAGADSTCAMAYWGVAMSYFHPLWWQREGELGLKEGQAAAERAAQLGASTRRERDYIAAVDSYYRDYATADPRARIQAYSDSMGGVHRRNRRDQEAAIFYALALIASAPPGDTTLGNQKRADLILDSLYAKFPNHPGLAHYLIHANDSPQLASLGLNAARRYARIAPAVPHALHMPSHIFLRLGLWDEAIASNERATAEGRRYQAEQQMAGTWFHNLHTLEFLETGYLQEGRDAEALRIVREVDTVTAITPTTPLGGARWLAVIPLRYALERGEWRDAAALRLFPVPESGPGTAFARELQGELLLQSGRSTEALTAFETALKLVPHRARSLYGAAAAAQRSGDSVAARRHYEEFVALMAKGDGQRPELQAAQRFLASR